MGGDVLMMILFAYMICSYGYDDLSKGRPAAQSTTAGCFPSSNCAADNAVDRIYSTCMKTKYIGLNAPDKTVWWFVDLGDILSIYSVRILFKNYEPKYDIRQRGRFAGFSIYLSQPSTKRDEFLCYRDGLPELPPLDFNTTCIGYSRYVMFYNERLDSVNHDGYQKLVITELCEVIVNGCKKTGVYGSNCNLACPDNCKNQRCNIVNGTCVECLAGWTGIVCENECPTGWYGDACASKCAGHCRENNPCNHVNGSCDMGCASGWMGNQCNIACVNGTYGPGCIHNCSGHCLNNTICDKETGYCYNGCSSGYTGNYCDQPCSPGFFGNLCKERCNSHCLDNKYCRNTDGTCPDGCGIGYIGERCEKKCEPGYFGANCSGVCSAKCTHGCRHTDGDCVCPSGYTGFNCSTAVSTASLDSADPSSDILVVGGAVGGCSVVIALTVLVLLITRFKRRKSKGSETKEDVLHMKITSSMKRTTELVPKRTIDQQEKAFNHITRHSVISVLDVKEDTKRGPPINKTIPVKNIQGIIAKMSLKENAGFKLEYHEIPIGEHHPCEEAMKPENKSKNRYKTTFPYDHSRVVLKNSSLSDGGYINANYIEDIEEQQNYIATQGPKPNTVVDFWRMIWQEKVFIIVCLTNLKEGDKNKCAQYWPDINKPMKKGDFNIKNVEEKIYANYTIRQFKFYNGKEKSDCKVTMFHYTKWPDHGVPDPLSLVLFHRQVMKTSLQYSVKCTVVHCSAGIGRTGTYIALDALYREGDRKGKINVPMYVRVMRKDRMNMIQGEEQYKTVYLALLESFRGKSRCLTTEQFLRECGGEACYANAADVISKSSKRSAFEELLSLRKEYSQEDYESGRANISANYTASVLPVERFMCRLSYTKGRSTYYNAVLHQTFTANDLLISAQYPLPDYTEDFLRLVKDFDVRVVVFMCPLKELKSSRLWFPSQNDGKMVGNFTVRLTTLADSENVSTTKIILDSRGGSEMHITVLGCKIWKDGEPVLNKRPLLDVIKEAKSENTKQEGRILILSSDGAARCGPFCVVYNALEQITMDTEVDIFTTTRQLQVRRPEFLSTLDEYQLCHDVVAEYLQNDSVYANS